jgi:hypothetical protein
MTDGDSLIRLLLNRRARTFANSPAGQALHLECASRYFLE